MTKEETQFINSAFAYADAAHKGQKDDTGKPFIIHPVQVANILMVVTKDVNLIAAAALHDTLEDTKTTYAELIEYFNKDVADLVFEVTASGSGDTKHFPNLKTKRGIMLKFADRLSNISRMETWDDERVEKYLKKSKFWKDKI